MKTSEILRIARDKYLKAKCSDRYDPERTVHVCKAIAWVVEGPKVPKADADKAYMVCDRISDAIDHHHTVTEWLRRKVGVKRSKLYDKDDCLRQAVYDYRHRWMTALIEEYEAKGD